MQGVQAAFSSDRGQNHGHNDDTPSWRVTRSAIRKKEYVITQHKVNEEESPPTLWKHLHQLMQYCQGRLDHFIVYFMKYFSL